MKLEGIAVNDLMNGFIEDDKKGYQCLFCDQSFEREEIFRIDERYFSAKRAVQHHIEQYHGSVFAALLALDKKYTGLSEVQIDLLMLFHEGLSDKEILAQSSANSVSTIRQHRFKLREKEKQAKVFLAIMSLLRNDEHYEPIHRGATQVDERYAITAEEKEKVLKTYFKNGLDGGIESFPSKEKRKIIILQQIITRFSDNEQYSEKEVNDVLKSVYSDYVSLRRYLIEYGFMDRSTDCRTYWVNKKS